MFPVLSSRLLVKLTLPQRLIENDDDDRDDPKTEPHGPSTFTFSGTARKLGESSKQKVARSLADLQNERNTPKPTEFREEAMVWKLYLEEAEQKADAKAKSWNTDLDSLLIFVGIDLFC